LFIAALFTIAKLWKQPGFPLKFIDKAGCWWLTPVILVTQEAEVRRIVVQSQPRQIVLRYPISKKPITNKGVVEWLKV
jgi:hypothetical protein